MINIPENHSGCSEIELNWLFSLESVETYCHVSFSFSSLLCSKNLKTSSEANCCRSQIALRYLSIASCNDPIRFTHEKQCHINMKKYLYPNRAQLALHKKLSAEYCVGKISNCHLILQFHPLNKQIGIYSH